MKYPAEKAVLEAKLVEVEKNIEAGRVKYDAGELTWNEFYPLLREEAKLKKMVDRVPPIFEVGDGVSLKGYTDVTPFEVIEVSKSGKTVTIREMKATLDPNWKPEMIPGGFSAHCVNNSEQKWILESNEDGAVRKISLRKIKLDPRYNNGIEYVEKWVPVGEKATIGNYPVLPFAKKFYDYNF